MVETPCERIDQRESGDTMKLFLRNGVECGKEEYCVMIERDIQARKLIAIYAELLTRE